MKKNDKYYITDIYLVSKTNKRDIFRGFISTENFKIESQLDIDNLSNKILIAYSDHDGHWKNGTPKEINKLYDIKFKNTVQLDNTLL